MMDCVRVVEELCKYEEKIAQGMIIQMYYYNKNCFDEEMKKIDQDIRNLAKVYLGVPTEENFLVESGRRDLDFEFCSTELANDFVQQISVLLPQVKVHTQMNIFGRLTPKPSMEYLNTKVENRRQEFLQTIC